MKLVTSAMAITSLVKKTTSTVLLMFVFLFMMNIVCNDDVTHGENAWDVETVNTEETKEENTVGINQVQTIV